MLRLNRILARNKRSRANLTSQEDRTVPGKDEAVKITYPVNGNTYPNTVSVAGTCSLSWDTVTVQVSTSVSTVTADTTTWSTAVFSLKSGQKYTASARVSGGGSSNVSFNTSQTAAQG